MLALYELPAEAPVELQNIDALYQEQPKPPLALSNSFEEETRDSRNVPPAGSSMSSERYTSSRGTGATRGMHSDRGGKTRGSYLRQPTSGRSILSGWHSSNVRMPTYSTGTDEDVPTRPWNNNNPHANQNRNSNTEQPEWTNKAYRSKRQGNNTNWRQQHSRDDGDEWRGAEPGRSRPQTDKWDRDWGERANNQPERQPWPSNRRPWVSSDSHNNDELPEWAVENAEAGGGTFDASGAFHGYSNDDTNLPKNQEVYPLTRSHTAGSFASARPRTAEEGIDDWRSSDKAKKLSPKRFDAHDIKFKKQAAGNSNEPGPSGAQASTSKDDSLQEVPEKLVPERSALTPEPPEASAVHETDLYNKSATFKQQFSESKTFDALMRSDINLEEASDERGNFQSVMITPNNSLRQKHQNMMPGACDIQKRMNRHDIMQMMQGGIMHHSIDEVVPHQKSTEEQIVDDLIDMTLDSKDLMTKMAMAGNSQMLMNQAAGGMPSGLNMVGNNMAPMQNVPMQQMRMQGPGLSVNHSQGMPMNPHQMNMAPGMQSMGMQQPMQSIGISNSALNASLGLSIGPNMGMPMQGVAPPVMPQQHVNNMGPGGMPSGLQQTRGRMPNFPSTNGMPGMPPANIGNRSLFLRQNPNNIQLPSDIPMPNHRVQSNMFPNHGHQHPGNPPQMYGNNSMYGNMIHQPTNPVTSGPQNLAEQWYYEDPKKTVQGPFGSKEMYNWYRAGFFSPSLMVRRACEVGMRPLGSYGPMVPFAQLDMLPPFPMPTGFEQRPQQHENMLNPQQGLGGMDMDSLWAPSTPSQLMWMQQELENARNEARANNLAMFLWDQQPNSSSSSLIPEDIVKEMKTEDQILAQLRAQSIGSPQDIDPPQIGAQGLSFIEPPMAPLASQLPKPDECYASMIVTPNLEELEKLLQKESRASIIPDVPEPIPIPEPQIQTKPEKPNKVEVPLPEPVVVKQQSAPAKVTSETKVKSKVETEKAKTKDNTSAKTKAKKVKEEKKEEVAEAKPKEDEVVKPEKKVEEDNKRSSSKSKKEEKASIKKELEKEKKEWIKDGFTIVKGAEKTTTKESKKKADEAKAAEEAERKRKEEEKMAADEEKRKKIQEAVKKQQEQQMRHVPESVIKKAPWSVNQSMQTAVKEPTLAEIQRLEREKKLEQMKEQQHMMQLIAQQQAAALAREQEMQAGLGWAKKMANNVISPSQSLAEIQAEARKQSAAAAASAAAAMAAAAAHEEALALATPPINNIPWASAINGGGFWDTQPNQPNQPTQGNQSNQGNQVSQTAQVSQANQASQSNQANQPSKPEKTPEVAKAAAEPAKIKKKAAPLIIPKKEVTPAAEFESWCTNVLTSYSAKIDVPTFIGFLKDIESPYDVRDYVKCYLGDTKDSNDFARQFLERRSKMIRVGMITPSDDLCSPALAVNPRTLSGSDYQEVKGKGKKTKKNKMMKIDARILGFSVTASEDRINVGDIDSV